ncbi:hypothetical protein [Serinibacter salmoneus]|uniref:Uncharacterized protein n=1 Tax=Serinibacter salmoneus TaxID=556530 RepID=A0A2A9D3P4_9MICO|nr:hypothetical protein [Serinibacter salmoneus]PFG20875.1 hypothetical protein ATL40_2490 [Serinibacter salmoneus]
MSPNSTAPDALPLGPGGVPADGQELLRRLWEAGTGPGAPWADLDPEALRAARRLFDQTSVVVDGADLARVLIDASGLEVPETLLTQAPVRPQHAPARPATARQVASGTIIRLQATAHPVRIAGAAFHLDAELGHQPVRWLETDGSQTHLEIVEPGADHPVTGHLHLHVAREEALDAARRLLAQALAAEGLHLVSLEAELTGEDGRSIHLDATARVRKGILSASARVRGTVTLSDDLVLHFDGVEVTSRNVVVAAVLAVVRSRIQAATQAPIAVGELIPAGVRLTDVAVRIDHDVEISARFS